MSTTAPTCLNCAAGHKPVWQPQSREWVHRWSLTQPGGGARFSITICTNPPKAVEVEK